MLCQPKTVLRIVNEATTTKLGDEPCAFVVLHGIAEVVLLDDWLRVWRHIIRIARAVGHFAPGIVTRMGGNCIAGSGERSELEPGA